MSDSEESPALSSSSVNESSDSDTESHFGKSILLYLTPLPNDGSMTQILLTFFI